MPVADITDHAPLQVWDFQTTDTTPVIVPLVVLSANGERALIPEMHAIGLTADGVVGNTLLQGFTAARSGGNVILRTLFNLPQSFGVGGLGLASSVSGDEVRLTCTGLAATTINWTVYWRLIRRPQS